MSMRDSQGSIIKVDKKDLSQGPYQDPIEKEEIR